MPTRYLKPGIRDSERIDALSPLAEVLFYRLLVTVDDFGRFDGRPAMVKSTCFPVREGLTIEACGEMLAELDKAGLLQLYVIDGKPYLQLHKWDNAPRAKESKFPAPQDERIQAQDTCIQVHTDVRKPSTVLPVTGTGTGTVVGEHPVPKPPIAAKAATAPRRGTRLPADWQLPKPWGEWALTKYPRWTTDKVRDEAAKFRNHWISSAGRSATKLDWESTWQNWCMSDIAHRGDSKQNWLTAGDDVFAGAV